MSGSKLREAIEKQEVDAAPAVEQGPLNQRVEKSKVRQKSYSLDLRIHSPASLGYMAIEGIDTAPALVRLAKVKGLDVIAVTDYFSGEYLDRVISAARDSAITVLPGVVLRCVIDSCDDVTLLCLFPEQFGGDHIDQLLRSLNVPREAQGQRSFVVRQPFEQIIAAVESASGIILPSRMDKTPQRLSVLAKMVDHYGFRAFDLAYPDSAQIFKRRWPKTKFQLFSFSNANALAQVGSRVARVKMQLPGFLGIKQLVERGEIKGA